MKTNTYRIFLKYLISHLILLLLPITILTFVVFGSFAHTLQEELISGNLNTLDKVRYAMDDKLKRVQEITNQLVIEDNSLYPYRIAEDWGYKSFGMVRELKRFRMQSPFVHEIWLHYKDEDAIFTSSSVYSQSMLVNDIYQFEDWPQAQLLQDLNVNNEMKILAPGTDIKSGQRYMRMVVPIFPNRSHSYATMVFLINEASIHDLMSTYTPTDGVTWIIDQNNQPVTSIGTAVGPSGADIAKQAQLYKDNPYREWQINDEKYYLFLVKSEKTGWKYVTLLPVSKALSKVEQTRQLYMYGVASILIFGGAIIFFSLRWNYRPIHRLRVASDQVLLKRTDGLNELETVHFALNTLVSQNQKLGERVKTQSQAVKKQLLLSLLKGEFDTAEELHAYGEEVECLISGTLFWTAIVEFPANLNSDAHPALEEMELLIPPPFQAYGMEHFEKNRYVLLITADQAELAAGDWHKALCLFRESICLASSSAVTMGVGSMSDINGTPRSYLEAKTAIGYRFVQGLNRTIFYGDIPVQAAVAEEYPHKDLKGLQQAIKSGSTNKINTSISAIIAFIRDRQPPLDVVRGLCFEIIRTVNGGWREMGLNEQSPNRYPDIFYLERLETIDEFEQLMHAVSRDLSSAFGNSRNDNEPTPANQRSAEAMLQYIRDHYKDSSFSLQEMSQHYGMALPNLSQFFKENTGQTPLEFTTSLRMTASKQLLLSTKKPLKAVAEEVGYNNVCSFIRRFKQLTGLTPGEFRLASKEPSS
ncbi:AraC family transcriptional regulator [Paenibacillus algorifonticola]|uniref:helix-turn-helix domain-containing protein n=1 Tax=Paenibacillus algorifonticola TaxID=684063 RepID=UPI003D2E4087